MGYATEGGKVERELNGYNAQCQTRNIVSCLKHEYRPNNLGWPLQGKVNPHKLQGIQGDDRLHHSLPAQKPPTERSEKKFKFNKLTNNIELILRQYGNQRGNINTKMRLLQTARKLIPPKREHHCGKNTGGHFRRGSVTDRTQVHTPPRIHG